MTSPRSRLPRLIEVDVDERGRCIAVSSRQCCYPRRSSMCISLDSACGEISGVILPSENTYGKHWIMCAAPNRRTMLRRRL
jgi:hypothetical protein